MYDISTVSIEWKTMLVQLFLFGIPLLIVLLPVRQLVKGNHANQAGSSDKLQELERRIERLEQEAKRGS